MRGRGPSKRRLAVVAVGALAVAIIAPLVAPSAGADVGNPGDLAVSMQLSLLTPTFTADGMATNGTGLATVSKTGLIRIPQPSLSFKPVDVDVALPAPGSQSTTPTTSSDPTATTPPPDTTNLVSTTMSVRLIVMDDFRGAINPKTGAAFLVGNVQLMLSDSSTLASCPVGPFKVIARTNAQGGDPYSTDTGSVTMVDPGFTIDAIPSDSFGCAGLENALNIAMSLPVTTTTTSTTSSTSSTTTTTFPPGVDPPVPSVVISLTFDPPLETNAPPPAHRPSAHPPTTSTTTTTTTTTEPTRTTEVSRTSSKQPTFSQSRPPRSTSKKKHHPNKKNPNKVPHSKVNPNKKPHSKVNPNKKNHPSTNPNKRKGNRTRGTFLPGGQPLSGQPAPVNSAGSSGGGTGAAADAAGVAGPAGQRVNFVTAAFVKKPASALSTGLDLLGLLGLLVFSSVALWLVTSEVSSFSASARRQRRHRIAGITRSR